MDAAWYQTFVLIENSVEGNVKAMSLIDNEVGLSRGRLSTSLLFLGAVGAILGARLHVVVIHGKSLVDLAAKSGIIIDAFGNISESSQGVGGKLTETPTQSYPSQATYQ